MEDFLVSARKYRPQTFQDVVGQEAITSTLQNAIQQNHLAQALLFCGPRGVGKTTCARIVAREINRATGTQLPDEDFSFNIFELDAASNNSVDDIRALTDQVRIPPQVGNYKVYIIDEVHMLSQAAFNAFLKTLEEPPRHAVFILATTEKHKIIPTILSRCQIFDFKRITVSDIKTYLKQIAQNQGVIAEDDALHIISLKADGALRDALSIFDRMVSFSGKNLTRQAVAENLNVLDYEVYFSITNAILKHDIPHLLLTLNQVLAQGFDGHHFITGLASHFRDLMVCTNQTTIALLEVGEDTKQRYLEQSRQTTLPFLLKALDLANECDLNYKNSKNQRLLVELCLVQLASIDAGDEKKKDSPFIIPPSPYEKPETKVQMVTPPAPVPDNSVSEPSPSYAETEEVMLAPPPLTGSLEKKPPTPAVSGFSLSSIQLKKKHEEARQNMPVETEDLPAEPFTESELQEVWASYGKLLDAGGKKIMASILSSAERTLHKETVIRLEFPNETMKKELEKEQTPLLDYLKEKLQNYHISFELYVNETTAEKYAFTPQEKYEKLRQKNPLIDLLRTEFDLEIQL